MTTTCSSSDESNSLDAPQLMLDRMVSSVIEKKGGLNVLKSQFLVSVCENVVGSENPYLINIQPSIKIGDQSEIWQKCHKFVISFLRRYKMMDTLCAMNIEYEVPYKDTDYTEISQIETEFDNLLRINKTITRRKTIIDKVTEFSREAGILPLLKITPSWSSLELGEKQDSPLLTETSYVSNSLEYEVERIMKDKKEKESRILKDEHDSEPEMIQVRVPKIDNIKIPDEHQLCNSPELPIRPRHPTILSKRIDVVVKRKISPNSGRKLKIIRKRIIKTVPNYVLEIREDKKLNNGVLNKDAIPQSPESSELIKKSETDEHIEGFELKVKNSTNSGTKDSNKSCDKMLSESGGTPTQKTNEYQHGDSSKAQYYYHPSNESRFSGSRTKHQSVFQNSSVIDKLQMFIDGYSEKPIAKTLDGYSKSTFHKRHKRDMTFDGSNCTLNGIKHSGHNKLSFNNNIRNTTQGSNTHSCENDSNHMNNSSYSDPEKHHKSCDCNDDEKLI